MNISLCVYRYMCMDTYAPACTCMWRPRTTFSTSFLRHCQPWFLKWCLILVRSPLGKWGRLATRTPGIWGVFDFPILGFQVCITVPRLPGRWGVIWHSTKFFLTIDYILFNIFWLWFLFSQFLPDPLHFLIQIHVLPFSLSLVNK